MEKESQRSMINYDRKFAQDLLKDKKALAVLVVDASSFRKIETEYGKDAYRSAKLFLEKMMSHIDRDPPMVRKRDTVTRRDGHGKDYIIFLDQSRGVSTLPMPGVLEELANRLSKNLNNAILRALKERKPEAGLPKFLKTMPRVSVGYASLLYNPALNTNESLENLYDQGFEMAKVQSIKDRQHQRELLHTLIQEQGLIEPYYQAIFRSENLSHEIFKLDKSAHERSITELQDHILGFESLIRVNLSQTNIFFNPKQEIIPADLLTPDLIFSLARESNVALELDQKCVQHAVTEFNFHSSFLFVNMLPRNLQLIGELDDLFNPSVSLVIEISESETINNIDVLQKIRGQNSGFNIILAVDDFGRAYTALDRVIELKPQIIKFDRSLIQDIDSDPIRLAYLKGLVETARLLNAKTLAEGVERVEEYEVLKKIGIEFMQGYLFHRPEAHNTLRSKFLALKKSDKETESKEPSKARKLRRSA